MVLMVLLSYKSARLFFCEIKKRKEFDCVCGSRFACLVRPLFIISMANSVQLIAVLFANFNTIVTVSWGYEILTLSIESSILGVAIFVLEIIEYVRYKIMEPKLMPVSHYGMKLPNDKNKLHKVSSGVLDMDDNHADIKLALEFKKRNQMEVYQDEDGITISDASHNALLNRNQLPSAIDKDQYTSEQALLSSLINQISHKTNIKMMEREFDAYRAEQEIANENNPKVFMKQSVRDKKEAINQKRHAFEDFRHQLKI